MKRLIAIAVSCLFFISLQVPLAAQNQATESNKEQERARDDYLFQYANYTEAHKAYETAKEAYKKFGTIASQQEAIEKTKQVLLLRAEVLRTYLQMLKVRLNGQRYLDEALRSSQFGKIEATQAFLNTHKENITKTKSVYGVNDESQRLEREAEAIQSLAYESLAFILIGEAQGLEVRTRNLLDDTLRQVEKENQAVEEGASDTRRKLTNARVGIDRTTTKILSLDKGKVNDVIRAYKDVQKEMETVKTSLNEAALLIEEIERRI
jgi:hypothetical protein